MKKGLLLSLLLCATLTVVFRISLLQAVSSFLIYEDELQKAPVMFVLSGGPLDRGSEAVRLYNAGWASLVICTGENIPHNFAALGIDSIEGAITKIHMLSEGLPEEKIQLIRKGTSTFEEAEEILRYCKAMNIDKAIIVSSDFHTRRIHRVIKKQFKNTGVQVIIQGATNTAYDKDYWWSYENGLIDVNNEYIKLLYYWWKH